MNIQISLSATKSDESDYHSVSGTMNIRRDFFNKNTAVTLDYTRFNDDYTPLEPVQTYDKDDDQYKPASLSFGEGGKKDVDSFTLGWSQALSRRTWGMVSLGMTLSEVRSSVANRAPQY